MRRDAVGLGYDWDRLRIHGGMLGDKGFLSEGEHCR
jgi:hypothetical protein